jgi:hypothetical protein
MSVQFDHNRNRWVVRRHEVGRQRTRRFDDEPAARRFDADQASNERGRMRGRRYGAARLARNAN